MRGVLPIAFALLASVTNAAEKTTRESLGSGGRTRTYYLFVPDSARGQEAVRLVVLLHGSGRVGTSLTEKWVSLAKKEGFIIAAPDSLRREGWGVPDDGPDFIYDLVETLKGTQPIDARRVYLFGHSAGAGHAVALGLMESEYFAGIAVHAGVLHPSYYPLIGAARRKTPVAIWIGSNDALFPLPAVRATRDALNSQGFDAQLNEITNHTHWYYDRAAEINIKVWAFLQKARLPGEPKYQRYQIAR